MSKCYYIQDMGLGMVPIHNKILCPEIYKKGSQSSVYLALNEGNKSLYVAGPIYKFNNDKENEVMSSEFITELEVAILEDTEYEGILTQEMLKVKLSKMIVDRFNSDKTSQQERDAILSAISGEEYFKGVMSQLKNVQKALKEEE